MGTWARAARRLRTALLVAGLALASACSSSSSYCRATTVLYIVEGGGHSWPGQPVPQFEKTFGPGTTEINATDLMFELFFGRSAR
jgi:poly(3-hydroxybutyrate) depolymerase